jgi:3-hydroxyisobutyrate dehydrogenase-like beta-hydroxyacid dehydrogenase
MSAQQQVRFDALKEDRRESVLVGAKGVAASPSAAKIVVVVSSISPVATKEFAAG